MGSYAFFLQDGYGIEAADHDSPYPALAHGDIEECLARPSNTHKASQTDPFQLFGKLPHKIPASSRELTKACADTAIARAYGAPYTKLVCMGRAVMIPGFLGSNIEGALHPERRQKVSGNWDDLAPGVKEQGSTAEEIFAGYYDVQKRVGAKEMKTIPYGAIAMWTLADKLAAGLQQLMAGVRRFSLTEISRNDLFSANRETEKETKIPFITDVLDESAKAVLDS